MGELKQGSNADSLDACMKFSRNKILTLKVGQHSFYHQEVQVVCVAGLLLEIFSCFHSFFWYGFSSISSFYICPNVKDLGTGAGCRRQYGVSLKEGKKSYEFQKTSFDC